MRCSLDEPSEPIARPLPARADFSIHDVSPSDPALRATLRAWQRTARALLRRRLDDEARLRLQDGIRIAAEIARVLAGDEPGEGPPSRRRVRVAVAGGRVQAVTTLFACPRAVFIELLASAPWNLLGRGARPDRRAVRGAGTALVRHARRLSAAIGAGGRVALQAENPRSRKVYEHLGFDPMCAADRPLTLVPKAVTGWAPPLLRLAKGRAAQKDQRAPFMLLEPGRARSAERAA